MKQHESSIEEILASNKVLSIEGEKEINMYAQYLMYRLERDFYDLCKEDAECQMADLEWDIFIEAFYSCTPVREAAEVVLRKTILDFPGEHGYFNFKATDVHFLDESDEELAVGDTIHAAKIFPLEKVAALVRWMLFQCEICFYQYQLNAGKDYSWNQYIDELAADRKMWDTVIDAFRDAITRLDYKPAWQLDNLEELVQQHKKATDQHTEQNPG